MILSTGNSKEGQRSQETWVNLKPDSEVISNFKSPLGSVLEVIMLEIFVPRIFHYAGELEKRSNAIYH